MAESLEAALIELRKALLDENTLRRAVGAGRRAGGPPAYLRVELRPVRVKSGTRLQVVTTDGTRPHTRNVDWGASAEALIDGLLAEPFGNWHVETSSATVQVRVTKRGLAQVHRGPPPQDGEAAVAAHDRTSQHLLDPGDPLFRVVGAGAAKRRQVDAFLRALAATMGHPPAGVTGAVEGPPNAGALPSRGATPNADALPRLRVVDLGCGNAYLTFAAYQYLAGHGYDVTMIGVDQREDQRRRNRDLAATLGWADRVQFVAASIAQAPIDGADLVLALHACDTATDEALTRAIGWQARYVLAAPCCHHDLAAQLKHATVPQPYQIVTKHPILRERLAEILTDALRANLVRQHGYHVDVVEFIESRHTGRNLLLRAAWTGTPATAAQEAEFIALTSTWGIRPRLADLLGA